MRNRIRIEVTTRQIPADRHRCRDVKAKVSVPRVGSTALCGLLPRPTQSRGSRSGRPLPVAVDEVGRVGPPRPKRTIQVREHQTNPLLPTWAAIKRIPRLLPAFWPKHPWRQATVRLPVARRSPMPGRSIAGCVHALANNIRLSCRETAPYRSV